MREKPLIKVGPKTKYVARCAPFTRQATLKQLLYQTRRLVINDMSAFAPIMAAESRLMISSLSGQENRCDTELREGPSAGELTQSGPNMLVSALVSLRGAATCIGAGAASSSVCRTCQQAPVYNRSPLLIGQAVCRWTSEGCETRCLARL